MKKIILWISIFFLFLLLSQGKSAGLAGSGQVLALDARMAGLGTSFDALSDNVDSVYYNPAGLALMENIMFNCSYLPTWDTLTSVYYFSVAFPSQVIPFGIGYCNVDSGGIPIRDNSPEILQVAGFQNISTFLSGSYSFVSGFSVGLRIKVNYVNLYDYHDWSMGADLAFLWRRPDPYSFTKSPFLKIIQPVSLGLILYNFYSSGVKLKESAERDPVVVKSSLSYRFERLFKFLRPELGLGLEAVPQYKSCLFNTGLELVLWDLAYIRSGYKITDNMFTIGTGIRVWDMTVDFGLSFLPISNNSYNLNLKIRFN